MATDEALAAALTYPGRPDAGAELRIRRHARRERLRRAFVAGGTCFGAAIAAVFLPLLHFLLVPALLVSTPLVFLAKLKEPVSVLGGRGACPACGAEQELAVRGRLRERTGVRCDHCGRALTLVAKASGPPVS